MFQRAGLDYDETFSPVARYYLISSMIGTAATKNFVVVQFDVKSAFRYGTIHAEIYMPQPQGFLFDDGSGRACPLKRSLYGLKQSL